MRGLAAAAGALVVMTIAARFGVAEEPSEPSEPSGLGTEDQDPPDPWVSDLPRTSELSWSAADDSWSQSAILDFAAVAVLGVGREAGYPEIGRLRGGEPEPLRLHVGGHGDFKRLAYVVRIDLAEPLRLVADDVRERPVASADRLIDAAYLVVRTGHGLRLLVGRQPLELSRTQEVPSSLLAGGVPPFVIDRVLPARRWGVRGKWTAGRFDAALGGWLDGDSIEARIVPGDPSIRKTAAFSASGRVGIVGDRAPHWHVGGQRIEARASVLVRVGDRARADAVVGLEMSRGRFATLLEALASREAQATSVGLAAELDVLVHAKVSTFVRLERDGEADLFAAGAGISYFATTDRRSRVALYGWLRRDDQELSERDGVVLQLQAEL